MEITKSQLRAIIQEEVRYTVNKYGAYSDYIKNPKTGRKVRVKTALSYSQEHPARQAAQQYLTEFNASSFLFNDLRTASQSVQRITTAIDNKRVERGEAERLTAALEVLQSKVGSFVKKFRRKK